MFDFTQFGSTKRDAPEKPVPSFTPTPQPKPSSNKTIEDLKFPKSQAVKNAIAKEERRKNLLERDNYDLTDFSALETDRGFIGSGDIADEVYKERKDAGEFDDSEDEIID